MNYNRGKRAGFDGEWEVLAGDEHGLSDKRSVYEAILFCSRLDFRALASFTSKRTHRSYESSSMRECTSKQELAVDRSAEPWENTTTARELPSLAKMPSGSSSSSTPSVLACCGWSEVDASMTARTARSKASVQLMHAPLPPNSPPEVFPAVSPSSSFPAPAPPMERGCGRRARTKHRRTCSASLPMAVPPPDQCRQPPVGSTVYSARGAPALDPSPLPPTRNAWMPYGLPPADAVARDIHAARRRAARPAGMVAPPYILSWPDAIPAAERERWCASGPNPVAARRRGEVAAETNDGEDEAGADRIEREGERRPARSGRSGSAAHSSFPALAAAGEDMARLGHTPPAPGGADLQVKTTQHCGPPISPASPSGAVTATTVPAAALAARLGPRPSMGGKGASAATASAAGCLHDKWTPSRISNGRTFWIDGVRGMGIVPTLSLSISSGNVLCHEAMSAPTERDIYYERVLYFCSEPIRNSVKFIDDSTTMYCS